jgi:hypothetical protein
VGKFLISGLILLTMTLSFMRLMSESVENEKR